MTDCLWWLWWHGVVLGGRDFRPNIRLREDGSWICHSCQCSPVWTICRWTTGAKLHVYTWLPASSLVGYIDVQVPLFECQHIRTCWLISSDQLGVRVVFRSHIRAPWFIIARSRGKNRTRLSGQPLGIQTPYVLHAEVQVTAHPQLHFKTISKNWQLGSLSSHAFSTSSNPNIHHLSLRPRSISHLLPPHTKTHRKRGEASTARYPELPSMHR